MSYATSPLLKINTLCLALKEEDQDRSLVHNVSFSLNKGETLGLVGESGSGKSLTALSIAQLLPRGLTQKTGSILFQGQRLDTLSESGLRRIRGKKIGFIFQEPLTALNPLHSIGHQIAEMFFTHGEGGNRSAVQERVIELLHEVGIPDAKARYNAYPHALSGGQRQRVMIAMAIALNPDLLIADEPTTALDVTLQSQVLDLIKGIQRKYQMGLLLITHDLGVVQKMADHVCIMQKGEIIEAGKTQDIFRNPRHTYTTLLLNATPTGQPFPLSQNSPVLLEGHDLKVWFPLKKGFLGNVKEYVKAVDGIDFSLKAGETLGIVGESGSGKSTLGYALLRLLPAQGKVILRGQDIMRLTSAEMRSLRSDIQIVFQDPFGSLSPRMTAGQIVSEGLLVHERTLDKAERQKRLYQALTDVGLSSEMENRYPHEFSGGQRQRLAIARALILKPKVIILDEPTSALDRSVQLQIIDLLRMLQHDYGLSYIFISHDLAVVRALSHRIMVMHQGKVVETGEANTIFETPQHPYTQKLIAATLRYHEGVVSEHV